MDIREEKKYIYEMMEEITKERRNLSQMYFDLKQRLDKLDELELRGLDTLSTQGYVDLMKKRDVAISANNIRREIEAQERKEKVGEDKRNRRVSRFGGANLMPKEKVETEMKKALNKIEEPETPVERIPKIVVEESKEKEKKRRMGKRTPVNFDKALSSIRTVLKESERPLQIAEIQSAVEKLLGLSLDDKNFRTNILYRSTKEDTRIERVGRGFYQYAFNEKK